VGGLPKDPNEQSIVDFFQKFGTIVESKMMWFDSGTSKGYCFITYDNLASAQAALDNYDNNVIDGKWVDVKPSDATLCGAFLQFLRALDRIRSPDWNPKQFDTDGG